MVEYSEILSTVRRANALLDADRILVVDDSSGDGFDFSQSGGAHISVTRTVQEFVQTDLENQYGFTFNRRL